MVKQTGSESSARVPFSLVLVAMMFSGLCISAFGEQSSPTPNPAVPSVSTSSVVKNGGFESGSLNGWKAEGAVEVVKSYTAKGYMSEGGNVTAFPSVKSRSGSWFLILGRDQTLGSISQKVRVPPETIRANLSFWYACAPTAGSKLSFSVVDNKGKPVKTANFTATTGWRQFKLDLNADCFGQDLTIRFRGIGITNYLSEGGGLITYECLTVLDDVGLDVQTESPAPSPTSTSTPTTTPAPKPTTPSTQSPEPTAVPKPTQRPTSAPTAVVAPTSASPVSLGVITILMASVLPVVVASIYIRRRRHSRLR